MKTDITELAQREKFEAWAEHACAAPWGYLKNRRTSDDAYKDLNTSDMWAAWKAAGAELVEALEKAQQRISELESPTFTFEVTAEPFTCPRCGTTTTHPEGWHYCHKREVE